MSKMINDASLLNALDIKKRHVSRRENRVYTQARLVVYKGTRTEAVEPCMLPSQYTGLPQSVLSTLDIPYVHPPPQKIFINKFSLLRKCGLHGDSSTWCNYVFKRPIGGHSGQRDVHAYILTNVGNTEKPMCLKI